jgi:Family of unknown function (DUF6263)
MPQRGRVVFWLLAAIAAAASGYIWWDRARTASEQDLEETLTGVQPAEVAPLPAVPATAGLQLHLKPGDVFPLVKTVRETVTQKSDNGPLRSETTVQLVLAIRVQQVDGDRKRLHVDYRRVKYEQDLAGDVLKYDSAHPPRVLPLEVQAYRGLVDNGFDFWVGPDNRILKIDGFDEFLKRCVSHVPVKLRQSVLTRFVKTTGDEGVANFIDDSIGLLPYRKTSVKSGDHWTRNRQVLRPVPLAITQTCTLKKLGDEFAEIEITGEIVPSTTFGPSNQPNRGLKLTVTGGKTVGSCRIRRRSGLPERSEIHRTYNMVVSYADGRTFEQTKEARTVIEVFTQQGAPKSISMAPSDGRASGARR